MTTLERNEALKAERSKQRFFAAELLDGLRGRHLPPDPAKRRKKGDDRDLDQPEAREGRHINARWIPVNFQDSDNLEPELNNAHVLQKPFNRTFGPGRSTALSRADYRALEVYPEWRDADGTAYCIVLGEPSLDALKVRWHLRGWACAHCAYPLEVDEEPNHFVFCQWEAMRTARAAVFRPTDAGFRRNEVYTAEQAQMALELLDAAQVLTLT